MSPPANIAVDLVRARWLLLAGFCLLLALHLPALGGLFTSDSLGIIAHCAQRAADGTLWDWLLQNFWHGLPASSHYYRPLSSASLCLDYQFYGPHPLGWRLSQLGLHTLNGLLVYRIGCALAPDARLRHATAALAAIIFWLSPAAPEVSIWIAGRYDALALLFMLCALLAQLRQHPLLAAGALALALCSKESAMITPPLLASISWWRFSIEHGPRPGWLERIGYCIHELWPSALIFCAYLVLRITLFGDPFSIYPVSDSLIHGFSWHWLERLPLLSGTLLAPWRESTGFGALFWLALFGAALAGAINAHRQRRWWPLWGLPALWLLIAVIALLPHLKQLSPAGQGSRLLYSASAWMALLLTLPWAHQIWVTPTRQRALVALGGLLWMLGIAQYPTQRDWTHATQYNRQLIAQLADTAARIPSPEWGLVLVPDHLGVALIARNAQGALSSPPFQPEPLLHQLIPFVPEHLEQWRLFLVDPAPWPGATVDRSHAPLPGYLYCADPGSAQLIPLPIEITQSVIQDPVRWKLQWQRALRGTRCQSIYPIR